MISFRIIPQLSPATMVMISLDGPRCSSTHGFNENKKIPSVHPAAEQSRERQRYKAMDEKKEKRRNTTDQDEDRISELPDVLLHHILSFMPFKSSIITGILSRRWKDVWKDSWAYTTYLDFGVEFITSFGYHGDAVRAINRYLRLHRGKNIETLRLCVCSYGFYDIVRPHCNRWVKFAIERRVRELDLDFRALEGFCKVPSCLFTCNSLTILKLVECKFDGCKLGRMLLNCLVLEKLTITRCLFNKLKLSSQLLKLKSLTLSGGFNIFPEIEICVPNLSSFHFCGYLEDGDPLKKNSSLEDAIVIMPFNFCRGLNVCQARVLPAITHVEILTTCNFSLFDFIRAITDEEHEEELPTVFPNLRELQLLLSLTGDRNLKAVCIFFRHFTLPCLEKLFIELVRCRKSCALKYPSSEAAELVGPTESLFCHLKKIKINGFSGYKFEMEFVKFLLEKALILESLVLVTPKRHICHYSAHKASTSQTEPNESSELSFLHQQLLLLPKASLNAQIILYEYPKDDKNLRPRHDAQAGDLLHFKDMDYI